MSDQTQTGSEMDHVGLPTLPPTADQRVACCGFSRLVVPALALLAVAALTVAAYFAGRSSSAAQTQAEIQWNLPPINATASATSEKFSVATGQVSPDAEGFFVLDHNSGLVKCNVIYPRIGRFMAEFTANVATDLQTGGKGGQYVMVTGRADFPSASNRPAGACILYVLDTSTGNYVAYGIPFDRVVMNRNQQQQGAMVPLYSGTANPLIDRDNLR